MNKESIIAKKRAKIEYTYTFKQPCQKCGDSRLYLIQFHHIDPKTKLFEVSKSGSHTIEDIEQEVKKCVCLCSNCHDEFHYFYGDKPENPVEALEEYLGKRIVELLKGECYEKQI